MPTRWRWKPSNASVSFTRSKSRRHRSTRKHALSFAGNTACRNWPLCRLGYWIQAKTVNGGASAKALDYALKRWPSLIRYAQTGHLPIDNNPVENAIRLIALGKKNWLFTGSERAGQRAAAIQSLLGTGMGETVTGPLQTKIRQQSGV